MIECCAPVDALEAVRTSWRVLVRLGIEVCARGAVLVARGPLPRAVARGERWQHGVQHKQRDTVKGRGITREERLRVVILVDCHLESNPDVVDDVVGMIDVSLQSLWYE